MNTKKLLLIASIQTILFTSTPLLAGDVEVTLPAETDAFTVDQPVGTELMRVNGDGNVGVGTATPLTRLHVIAAPDTSAATFAADNDKTAVAVVPITDNPGDHGKISIKSYRTSDGTADWGTITTQEGSLVLSGHGSATIDLTINNSGDVGIGTLTPSTGAATGGQSLKLDVEGAVGATHYCDENGENCQTAASLGGDPADNLGNHTATQNIDLAANKLVGNGGTEGIVVADTGKVGIGVADPDYQLDVNSSPYNALRLIRDSVDPGKGNRITMTDSDGDEWSLQTKTTNVAADNSYEIEGPSQIVRLHIDDANGNIGIGTVAPSATLDVDGNIKVGDEGNNTCDATNEGQIRYNSADKKHQGCNGTTWNDLY